MGRTNEDWDRRVAPGEFSRVVRRAPKRQPLQRDKKIVRTRTVGVTVRMDRALKAAVEKRADTEGTSLTALLHTALRAYLAQCPVCGKKAHRG